MSTRVTVTTTPAHVLREAGWAGAKEPATGDICDRLADGVDALGFAIVPKAGTVLGPVAVTLPEPDDTELVDGDDGSGLIPSWALGSGTRLRGEVLAWSHGIDFDGELVDGQALEQVERDALAVLAAIARSRSLAAASSADEQQEEAGDGS